MLSFEKFSSKNLAYVDHRVDLRSTFLQELFMCKESDSDFKKCQRFQVSTFCYVYVINLVVMKFQM